MSADEVYAWLEKLRVRRSDQDVIAACVTVAPLLAEHLQSERDASPSQLQEVLGGRRVEILLMAVLHASEPAPVDRAVRGYLEDVRGVELEVGGDDLRAAGVPESPAIGDALKRTLALKLDGQVRGRDAELEAALRFVRESTTAGE
jgi:tRNA nucleotidyltransferase (CCA-adding enzyme)